MDSIAAIEAETCERSLPMMPAMRITVATPRKIRLSPPMRYQVVIVYTSMLTSLRIQKMPAM